MAGPELLRRTADDLDAVSWHFYGGVSPRCGGGRGIDSRDAALSDDWLDLTLVELGAVEEMRDEYAPAKPLWLTETAQAACGGSPWAATFRDTFRYLSQLGSLARRNVQVVMHNTLAASEYGLLDADTLEPRPNYWGAVLWQRLMGPVVLDAPEAPAGLRLYAHCLPQMNGGVGLLALNTGSDSATLAFRGEGREWTLQAEGAGDRITVNGTTPEVRPDGSLSGLEGMPFRGGTEIPAEGIVFIEASRAANPACVNGG